MPPKLTPVDMDALSRKVLPERKEAARRMKEEGISSDEIAERLQLNPSLGKGNTGLFDEVEENPDGENRGNEENSLPDPALSDVKFLGGGVKKGVETNNDHPLLKKLEIEFGIKKLETKSYTVGDFTFVFRPQEFIDFEWMHCQIQSTISAEVGGDPVVTTPAIQLAEVCSSLAAINDTPIYEIMGVETKGRFIPDPLLPPPDIRKQSQDLLIQWMRHKLGLLELVPLLAEICRSLFKEEKENKYPLAPLIKALTEILYGKYSVPQEESGKTGESV